MSRAIAVLIQIEFSWRLLSWFVAVLFSAARWNYTQSRERVKGFVEIVLQLVPWVFSGAGIGVSGSFYGGGAI